MGNLLIVPPEKAADGASDTGEPDPHAASGDLSDIELAIVLDRFSGRRCFTEAELAVFESYFADILDAVLGGAECTPAASLRHNRLT